MVESTALEMRRTRKGTVGSNPTLSAIKKAPFRGPFLMAEERMRGEPMFDKTRQRFGASGSAARSAGRQAKDENRPMPVFANPTPLFHPPLSTFRNVIETRRSRGRFSPSIVSVLRAGISCVQS